VFVLHLLLQQLRIKDVSATSRFFIIISYLPKGSGILKNKSFLTSPSAAMTVNLTVLVEFDMIFFYCFIDKKKEVWIL
jgi:hypothetical protein